MKNNFEDFDFVVLNEVNTNGRFSSEDMDIVENRPKTRENNVIRIYDLNDNNSSIEFTYEKLFEILEARTDGLKPEIWY